MVVVLTFPSSTLEASRQRNLVLNLPPSTAKDKNKTKSYTKQLHISYLFSFTRKLAAWKEMRWGGFHNTHLLHDSLNYFTEF